MPNPEFQLYSVHGLFWTSFGVSLLVLRLKYGREKKAASAGASGGQTASHSGALLVFHMLAFGVMYLGIAVAVFRNRVPVWFAAQRSVGTVLVAVGAVLMVWAMFHFQSWRFRATLDQGHQLATGGPFRILRHPIYMSLNLLALGSAIWVPSPILWVSVVLMVIGSELRARAEERILAEAFGDTYREYCRQTFRFLPYVY